MEGLKTLYEQLLAAYGHRHWWPAQTPYEMMVGAILTQNTAWTNVEKALSNFGDRLTPEYILAASPADLAACIRSSGYHNQKALKLKALTQWFSRYDCDITLARRADGEALRLELLAVKGIGGETADAILTYALNKPFFVVDAYTRRLLHRYGYDLPGSYESLRKAIEENIPKELPVYNEFHALIVEHAKRFCRVKPLCEECPLKSACQKRI